MIPTVSYAVVIFIICISVNAKEQNGREYGRDYKDVKMKYGDVRGWMSEDGDYYAFLGIPYATAPIGKNRFKEPLPPNPWQGVLYANRTVKCPQMGEGDEDCLILNVFTPTRKLKHPFPVLVYIHGGAFIRGSGQMKGVEPLIRQDIIVVTINYRLGALGFLCLGIQEAPGNAGLKDQVAALKWVQENIGYYGGDPKQVTIHGTSAGGASVGLLMLSELTKGLFQKAIVESASATPVWTIDADPITTAMNVATSLNFPMGTKNLLSLVEYYQQIPHTELSVINFEYFKNLTDGTIGFVPCIEKSLYNTTAFIKKSPYDMLLQENFNKVPVIFMFASCEGLNLKSTEYYEQNYKERMQTNFVDFMPPDLIFDTEDIQRETAEYIKYFYFGNKTIDDDTLIEYLNYFGDFLILHSLLNEVEIHARDHNPVYLMEFAYKGNMVNHDIFYENIRVAGHGDIVKHAILNNPIGDDSDRLIVNRLSRMIANFVKYGNPIPKGSPLLPTGWPTVQSENIRYLHMDYDFDVRENPYWNRKEFWDQLYGQFRRPLIPVDTDLWV